MKEYNAIKAELIKRREKITHFTRAFYTDFQKAIKSREIYIKNNIDDSYYNGNIKLFHSFDNIYSSKFYNLNSCAYCVFLEIVNSN